MNAAALETVGFIGLGDQGGPMATALIDAGFKLGVWARRQVSLAVLAGRDYADFPDASSLAATCTILVLCLREDNDIIELLDAGVETSLQRGAIVVNHATGTPEANALIAARLASRSVQFVDAPVSGGRPAAERRALTTYAGGEDAPYARCLPLFSSFSTTVAHMGSVGSGQRAKLLNNALTISNLKNVVDVLFMAHDLGVNPAILARAVATGSGGSAILNALLQPMSVTTANHLAPLMEKDLQHFLEMTGPDRQDATDLVARAQQGAQQLSSLIRLLASAAQPHGELTVLPMPAPTCGGR